jgi:histidyl-tRNA synthetase
MASKFHKPSGFPENLPGEQIAEERLKARFREAAELYGYVPLETSAVEYLDTLVSKGEITKEIYTIGRAAAEGSDEEPNRGLRFDLTVPFARYTAEHYGDLAFPFKRYQVQRVWRGERPQKGRFREFYQMDVDVVANEELPIHFDAEVILVAAQALASFNIGGFTIRLNNRKLLEGMLLSRGVTETARALQIIDKIDKVGVAATATVLRDELGMEQSAAEHLLSVIGTPVPIEAAEALLRDLEGGHSLLEEGKAELLAVASELDGISKPGKAVLDLRIARGLDYYTGTVCETTIDGLEAYGSICSGGRYADLAGRFINRKLPGVGVSIGLTRLLSILIQENRIGTERTSVTDVLIGLFDEAGRELANRAAETLRSSGVRTEVFHSGKQPLGKQIEAAVKRGIPYFVIMNESGSLALKDLASTTQADYADLPALLAELRSRLGIRND